MGRPGVTAGINDRAGGYRIGGYVELAVPEPLRNVAEVAWMHAPAGAAGLRGGPSHRVIPETGVSLCFLSRRDAAGRVGEPSLLLMGPIRSFRFYTPDPAAHMEGVRLKPEWCRRLLGIDPGEHVDALGGEIGLARRFPGLRDGLARTASPREALRLLVRVVGRLVEERVPGGTSLAHAVLEGVRLRPGLAPRLRAGAMAVGVSERHLRRLIRDATGGGLKRFQQVRRLQAAVSLADAAASVSWARVAAATGYYDQAHLINECRALTGTTPSRLRAERRSQPRAHA